MSNIGNKLETSAWSKPLFCALVIYIKQHPGMERTIPTLDIDGPLSPC